MLAFVGTEFEAHQIEAMMWQFPEGERVIPVNVANTKRVRELLRGRSELRAIGLGESDARYAEQLSKLLKLPVNAQVFGTPGELTDAYGIPQISETLRSGLRKVWTMAIAA